MTDTRKSLFLLLCLSLAACGGSTAKTAPTTSAKAPAASPKASSSTASQAPEPAPPAAPTIALPEVPSSPAALPSSVMMVATLAKPNTQITQIGTFVDAIMPGMGAFMTPASLARQVGGIAGVPNIKGIDLNQPLHLLSLDNGQVLLVATVSSEAVLTGSLEGTKALTMLHDGFVAIGQQGALVSAGPYALSNLAKSQAPALPTMTVYPQAMLSGAQGEKIRKQILGKMVQGSAESLGAEMTFSAMADIEIVTMDVNASPAALALRMRAGGVGGALQSFLAAQHPANFSMIERIGSGPWAGVGIGRLDLTPLLPLLIKLGEHEANPLITQFAAQLGSLNGEMALGLQVAQPSEVVTAMKVSDSQGLAKLIEVVLEMISKEKALNFGDMKGRLKLNALKSKKGKIHQLKLTPNNDAMKARYGAKGVSVFFGVAADTLLATFGPSAKKQARMLLSNKGSIPGKGTKLAKVVEQAKAQGDSYVVAFDFLAIQGKRAAQDIAPVVLGLGFGPASITGRLVIPTSTIKSSLPKPL